MEGVGCTYLMRYKSVLGGCRIQENVMYNGKRTRDTMRKHPKPPPGGRKGTCRRTQEGSA